MYQSDIIISVDQALNIVDTPNLYPTSICPHPPPTPLVPLTLQTGPLKCRRGVNASTRLCREGTEASKSVDRIVCSCPCLPPLSDLLVIIIIAA